MDIRKHDALKCVDQISGLLYDISDAIWDASQLDDWEIKSARLQLNLLEKLGFLGVQIGLGNIPNAFSARWGSGKPVIGFLGEFDALPSTNPKTKHKIRASLDEDGNNCSGSQNLLGTGAIAAAYILKEHIKNTGKSGTVIYYGCPVLRNDFAVDAMARNGVFDELDVALSWYPDSRNAVCTERHQVSYTAHYKFKAAIATQTHIAQSAIDFMNLGVEVLRKHIKPSVRIHCAAVDAKSNTANVIQSKKEACYIIRANEIQDAQNTYEQLSKVARGAAVMADAELEVQLIKSSADLLTNHTLNQVLYDNLKTVELPVLTDEDINFAQKIYDSLENKEIDSLSDIYEKLTDEEMEWLGQQDTTPLCRCVIPLGRDHRRSYASIRKSDISWIVPTARILAASWVAGVSDHTAQTKAMAKSNIAHKSIVYSAKVLAGAAVDLVNNPVIIKRAKEELRGALNDMSLRFVRKEQCPYE